MRLYAIRMFHVWEFDGAMAQGRPRLLGVRFHGEVYILSLEMVYSY
jgi:hypothetical protein